MHEFEGKTAVITGGASGIGLALAKRFGDARMQVVLADIEEEALHNAVKELGKRQYRVIGVVSDTMRRQSVEDLADRVTEEFGNIHVLCNNAGDEARAVGKALLAQGKQPEEIADIVFEAIRNSEFYILPHPAGDDTVRKRVECVIDRKAPMEFDMAELLKRQEAGEAL